jgi:hypothetical protein
LAATYGLHPWHLEELRTSELLEVLKDVHDRIAAGPLPAA